MRLVEFENGKWGVRRFTPFVGFEYLDLDNTEDWWDRSDRFFCGCLADSREDALRAVECISRLPRVVRVHEVIK